MGDAEQVQIIIVSNNSQVVKRFEKQIALIENIVIIKKVGTAMDTMEILRDTKPEVALVDFNLPDMNGIKLTELIRQSYPLTQVVIVAQDKHSDNILNALRNGASDFLTYEADLDELKGALQKAGGLSLSQKKDLNTAKSFVDISGSKAVDFLGGSHKGNIITVYSSKGGAGVTSLAVNLAIALQNGENTVALVDGDLQFGDIGLFLNQTTIYSVTDLISHIDDLDKKIIEDVMALHKASGLYLLAAPQKPEYAEQVSGANFGALLEYMRYIFNYIVVNTSSYISDPCLAALDAGDVVILMTTQEIASVWGTRRFLGLWEKLGMSKSRLLLIVNRYQKNTAITPDKIGEGLKLPVILTIDENELVNRSANLGAPFILNDKDSIISKGVYTISEQIRKRIPEEITKSRFRLFEAERSMSQPGA